MVGGENSSPNDKDKKTRRFGDFVCWVPHKAWYEQDKHVTQCAMGESVTWGGFDFGRWAFEGFGRKKRKYSNNEDWN